MSIDQMVMFTAGTMMLVSVVLTQLLGPQWLLLSAFVGFNLFQASITKFCPFVTLLKRMGVRSGHVF
jgi:hypothetical protein